MRVLLLLLVACAAAAAVLAAPSPDERVLQTLPIRRVRRFLDWDVDGFLHRTIAGVQRALAASRRWLNHNIVWLFRGPAVGRETVYRLDLPGGGHGVVRILDFQHGHRQELAWDGRRLSWELPHHHGHGQAPEDRIRLTLAGRSHVVPLGVLAKHLKHVAAGRHISAELLGKTWKDLRLVLHVRAKHGKEDAQKSVSVLVWKLLAEAKKLHALEHHGEHNNKQHGEHKKNHEKHHEKDQEKHHKSGEQGKKKASNRLVWTGQGLAWDDSKSNTKKGHGKRQLRITQDGVVHFIPLSVLSKHVGAIPTGSKIDLKIKGKKLGNIRILLDIHRGAKTKTITVPIAALIKQADASGDKGFHGGKVLAQVAKQVKGHGGRAAPAVKQI